ncbi:MAG: hypothetical protein RIC16_09185 [Rhodospirillales bacterium]
MRKLALVVIVGLGLVAARAPSTPASAGNVQIAQQGLLQCMTQCIKQEGEDEYDTCKLRCANVPMEGGQQQDCMAVFKDCKKACGDNNACRKECKGALMTCS